MFTDQKSLYAIIPVLLVSLIISGLVSSEVVAQDEVTLRFVNWASAEKVTKKSIDKVIEEFEAENPNINVKNIPVPFNQIRPQLLTMSAGGNPPDVMQLAANWPFELAAMGVLQPLSKYASEEYLADNWQQALEAGTYEGKLIAVPWGVNYFGFWYNKKLMKKAGLDPKEPPETWSEFMDALDKVHKNLPKEIDAFELFTGKAVFNPTHNWSLFWGFGAFPLENKKIGVDNKQFENYLSWVRKMIKDNYTTGGWKLREFRQEMANGKLVFAFDGPYVKGTLKSINPNLTKEEIHETYGVTALPAGVNGEHLTGIDMHQLAMSKKTENKEAAWKFIKFLTSSDIAIEEYLIPLGAIPPLKTTVNKTHKEYFDDPISQSFIQEVLPTGRPIPYGPRWGDAGQKFTNAVQKAAFSDTPIDVITETLEKNLSLIYPNYETNE